ncbi:MAG: hypothetical protein KC445_07940 [Anaerolineales bacterium]|nr:hypothetical protein [Anaerolineales bacterium]
MNQVFPRNILRQLRFLPLAGLLLLIALFTACSGSGDDAAPEVVDPAAAVLQTGSLTCSQTCLAQGQCGTAADGRTVILAHSGQPKLRDHDTLLADEAAVTILNQQTLAISDAVGAISSMSFFNVQPTGGPASWVSGSCVNLQ